MVTTQSQHPEATGQLRSGSPWEPWEDAIIRHVPSRKDRLRALPHRTFEAIKTRMKNLDGREPAAPISRGTWERVTRRLRAGQAPSYVASFKGMPDYTTIRFRLMSDQAFATSCGLAGFGSDTFNWDIGDRIIAAVEGGTPLSTVTTEDGFPPERTVSLWRKSHPDFDAALMAVKQPAKNDRFREHEMRNLMEALQSGRTLADITRPGENQMISAQTITRWRKRSPEFDRLLRRLTKPKENGHLKARAARFDSARAFEAARRAVPGSWPEELREEVIAEMALALVERRLSPKQIPGQLNEFRKLHYRRFSNYGPQSLDAPIGPETSTKLVDTITEGFWDPA